MIADVGKLNVGVAKVGSRTVFARIFVEADQVGEGVWVHAGVEVGDGLE